MKCAYCGKGADFLTSLDKPICLSCAQEKHFLLCTELGKYIVDTDFICDQNCYDCIYKELR